MLLKKLIWLAYINYTLNEQGDAFSNHVLVE